MAVSQVSVVKLTDTNYKQWSIEIKDALSSAGLWPAVLGQDQYPLPPVPPPTKENHFCLHQILIHLYGNILPRR